MCEELVKRLMYCRNNAAIITDEELVEIAEEAADAIEGLSKQHEAQRQNLITLINEKPRWISVAERLPKGEAERYLVATDFMAHGLRVSICYYAENLEEVDKYDFNGEKHGGFYGNDGEYGYYEKNGVKYWMPLPQPPEEKS